MAAAPRVEATNQDAYCANETRNGSYHAPLFGFPGLIFRPAYVHEKAAEEERRERIKCMITDLR